MKTKRVRSKYPPYPGSGYDYSVVESARQRLEKPNRVICIYCHGQAENEEELESNHQEDCPAKGK